MQIVIDITDDIYAELTKTGENEINIGILLALREAVRQGTPLPKGHGAIKDVSKIEIPMCEDRTYERWVQVAINSAPTIIDKEQES